MPLEQNFGKPPLRIHTDVKLVKYWHRLQNSTPTIYAKVTFIHGIKI